MPTEQSNRYTNGMEREMCIARILEWLQAGAVRTCSMFVLTALGCGFLASMPLHAQVIPPAEAQGDGRVSPFYTWQESIPGPGRLLRDEPLPATLGLTNAGRQSRILYSSTDGIGGKGPVVVSGALFLPKGAPPPGGWPVVAWAHGTVGIADVCAPSWNARSYRDGRYLSAWLDEGFAVVATDYQGLGTPGPHPYLHVRPEAYSVLDSIRAVQRAFPELSPQVVLVGQSQGGAAAFATAGLAPQYAPELDIRATVVTGAPYLTLAAQAKAAPQDPNEVRPQFAYFPLMLLTALQARPELDLAGYVTERAMPLVESSRVSCIDRLEMDVVYAGLTLANAFKPDAGSLIVGEFPRLEPPTLKIPHPVFLGIGGQDRDVSPTSQLQLAEDSCAAGTVVEAHLYADLDHSGTVNASLKDSIPFVRKALGGKPVLPVCKPSAQ